MTTRLALGLLGLALLASGAAADEPAYVPTWEALLAEHTRSVPTTVGTTVDYAALKGASRDRWRQLLRQLDEAPAPESREETLALWINAYNILTIDKVLGRYPVDSIRDIGSFFSPVWDQDAGRVAGREVSLGEIEHGILRKLGEPRIHAAIVCASTSCPSLRRTPFTARDLDAQLDEAMRQWLASPSKGMRIDREDERLTVSRIFDWFEDDFDVLGGVRAALTRYAPEADRGWLASHAKDGHLDHFDYDWRLNDVRRAGSATNLPAP